MARARNIKPAFFKNEDLADLPIEARFLFIGLWCLADREGRLPDRPRRIGAEIYPYDKHDIDALLQKLADSPGRFIVRYEADNGRHISISAFTKHQNPHCKEQASSIPAPGKHGASSMSIPPPHIGNKDDSISPCIEPSYEKHGASTGQAQCAHQSCPAESLLPITDSPILIPDSPTLIPESVATQPSVDLKADRMNRSANIRAVFDHYRTLHPRANPKPSSKSKVWRKIRDRLEEGSTVEDLKAAIDGCHRTPHNIGENERGQKYLSLELIVRDSDQVSRFMEAPTPEELAETKRKSTQSREFINPKDYDLSNAIRS